MKPKEQTYLKQHLFETTLEDLCNPKQPLVILAKLIDWKSFDTCYESLYCENNGAPGIPTRMMVGLQYLKYVYNLSDEETVARWLENPYWQYFCGEEFFQFEMPIHPSSMTRWRKRIGEEKLGLLLEETIRLAQDAKYINRKNMEQVVVDTTVQEKNITYPTDAKQLYKAIVKAVKLARLYGIRIRQSYLKKAKKAMIKAGRYTHAQQYKRRDREIRNLKNWLGRLVRELQRGSKQPDENLKQFLELCEILLQQTKNSKQKIYSIHEPEVQCISKGKSRVRYEFGQKASIITTNRGSFILSAKLFEGNPYDGHTLNESIKDAEKRTNVVVTEIQVDNGYRGHDYIGKAKVIKSGDSNKKLSKSEIKRKRRRSTVEPVIGHMKSDHRLGRCFLKGLIGDAINILLSAVGKNMRKLLSLIAMGRFFPVFIQIWRYLIVLLTLWRGSESSPKRLIGQ